MMSLKITTVTRQGSFKTFKGIWEEPFLKKVSLFSEDFSALSGR